MYINIGPKTKNKYIHFIYFYTKLFSWVLGQNELNGCFPEGLTDWVKDNANTMVGRGGGGMVARKKKIKLRFKGEN